MAVFRQPPNIRPNLVAVAVLFGGVVQPDSPPLANPPLQGAHAAFYAQAQYPRQGARLVPAPFLPPDVPPPTVLTAPAAAYVRPAVPYPDQATLVFGPFSPPDGPAPVAPWQPAAYVRTVAPPAPCLSSLAVLFGTAPTPDSPPPTRIANLAAYLRDAGRAMAPRVLEPELLDYYEDDGAVGLADPQLLAALAWRAPALPARQTPPLAPPLLGAAVTPDNPPAVSIGLRTPKPTTVPMPLQRAPLGALLENLGDPLPPLGPNLAATYMRPPAPYPAQLALDPGVFAPPDAPPLVPSGLRTPAALPSSYPTPRLPLGPLLDNLGDALPPAPLAQYRPAPPSAQPVRPVPGPAAFLPPDAPVVPALAAPASAYLRPQPPYPAQVVLAYGPFAAAPTVDNPLPGLPVQVLAAVAYRPAPLPGRQIVPLGLFQTLPDAPPAPLRVLAGPTAWRPPYSAAAGLALAPGLYPPDEPPLVLPVQTVALAAWRPASLPGHQLPGVAVFQTLPDAPPLVLPVSQLAATAWRPAYSPAGHATLAALYLVPPDDAPLRLDVLPGVRAWSELRIAPRQIRYEDAVFTAPLQQPVVVVSLDTPIYLSAALDMPVYLTVNLDTPMGDV